MNPFANVPWKVRDALVLLVVPWMLLPLALFFWAGFFGSSFPLLAVFVKNLERGDIVASFGFVILELLTALAVLSYYQRQYNFSWGDLGLRSFSLLKAVLFIVVIFLVFGFLLGVVYALVKHFFPAFNPDQAQTNEFISTAPGLPQKLSFVALVIIPPILEETIFRGFMFPAMAKRFGPVMGAILASILFGLAHLQVNVGIYTFLLGLLLCLMYYKLRSTVPGMVLHALNNYAAYMALLHK